MFDLPLFALAAFATVFAGISKGGFGSGASFASASILALVLAPGQALGIMLPLLILIDLTTLKPYWRKWQWPTARLLMVGSVPGVILGVVIYKITNDDVIRFLIGAMALLFVMWQGARALGVLPVAKSRLPVVAGLLAGCVAGFTSFVSHAGGPPAAMYMLSLKMSKTEYHANTLLVFTIVNLLKAVGYSYLGIFTAQTLMVGVYLAPFALIGAWIGVKAHYMVPERAFFILTYVLLIFTGSKLIFDAIT
ncbi:sulfite exporter TauE/SafE family protein [Planktotalea sp.]|uniref:sulfite exporter TauE/SafE family protein n=1 Tax=Planktotalea sp. TaxID=2029877 RepID=UPI0025FAC8C8|nr:sulfite exporter TauE/SafE family protein [Planktotalea sp.]